MTKIPVDYAYEEIWKVSERREDKKMESEVPTWMWALLGVSIGLLLFALFKPLVLPASNPDQAQCESIGGRYDGESCWYNGSKVDVNKYVEEWK